MLKKLLLATTLLVAIPHTGMAQALSDSALINDINSNFPTNTTGQIKASNLRSVLIDIVNNKINNQTPVSGTSLVASGPYAATDLGAGGVGPIKISGTMSGNIGPTGAYTPVWLDIIDNVTGFNLYSALFTTRVNSTLATGARNGLTGQTLIQSPTSPSNTMQFYVGVSGTTVAGTGDNGTALSHRGNIYGLAGQCILQSGATYWNSCQGMNVSLTMHTGSEAQGRVGYSAEADGEIGGSLIDTAYDVYANSAPWFTGLLMDDSGGAGYPLATGGTIVRGGLGGAVTRSLTAGIDFSMLSAPWSGTGNAIILPPGNGGIQWGSAAGGGAVISATGSGGMVQVMENGSITLRSSNVVEHFFDAAGNYAAGGQVSGVRMKTTPVTVASLPTCNSGSKGTIASVSDAAATPVYNATVAGGGSVSIPVYCNGTNWTNH